ncbi:MAG: glycosyltransferase family 2 protein [Clostridia bacterium]|nr:glycosyltransferase family 2 protein [Clostridia bacterium]
MRPLVSVIVPTYNRPNMVLRAVNSILGQDYDNIEIIVVDDNPADSQARRETEEVMKAFAGSSRVKYIKDRKSLGGSGARNIGIDIVSGDYVSFLDDDDVYLQGKISAQVDFMEKSGCDMSFSNVRIHDTADNLIDFREHEQYLDSMDNTELLKQHIMHSLTPTATYMYKTEMLKKVGGFRDVPVGQEFDLMLRTIRSGIKIGFFNNCDVVQYHHSGERISLGTNKLNGEMIMYDLKRRYFDILDPKQCKFIEFRHYVVLAVASLRSGKILKFIKNGFLAFAVSPYLLFTEFFSHRQRINRHKKDKLNWVK